MALAMGVNMILTPDKSIVFSGNGLLCPDGACKPFDMNAQGYVRSEGCDVVVLKRLEEEVRDGNHVHAVLAGTATMQDSKLKANSGRAWSASAPDVESQKACIKEAFRVASIGSEQVGFVEANGSGSPQNEFNEAPALSAV
jgi:acyl transferase domain-containing protein